MSAATSLLGSTASQSSHRRPKHALCSSRSSIIIHQTHATSMRLPSHPTTHSSSSSLILASSWTSVRQLAPSMTHILQKSRLLSSTRENTNNNVSKTRTHHHRQRRTSRIQINAGGPGGGMGNSSGAGPNQPVDTPGKKALVGIAVTYMLLIVLLPFINVFVEAFKNGPSPFFENLVDPDFLQAVKMTLLLSAVAVPINTVFGICAALFLSRNDFPGKVLAISILDLPFSISPVVTGMMFVLLYGRKGLFAPLIAQYGFPIIFAFPGMALATLFVTMPFVVRELLPILDAMDMAEEEAARSLGASPFQVFWNVTLPNIRWGLLYGIILTNARAMGEFGAVSIISGNIIGQTQTLTLFVESSYKEYNSEAAFAAAVLLSLLALVTLVIKENVEGAAAEEVSK